MRKTVKKIAALVAGTTMVGATIMGAMALDLSNYPAPFVSNGVFDGKIVVGAKAATSDVVGSIDLAASLQASATTTTEVELPDTAGQATLTGDKAEFKTGVDVPSLTENLRDVKGTFSALDLEGLKDGVFDTGLGSTPVKQYLKFDPTTATDKSNLSVVYAADQNNDDKEGDYVYMPSDGNIFEYHLEFTEGAVSEIGTSGALDDLEKEAITILGAPFTITEAKRSTGNQIEITMLGGEVGDVLKDGETKTYTINGKDYEVTAVFISSDSQSAKLSVNGMMTKELTAGKTEVLGGDVTLGVQEILTNQREGLVEFYLGANKVKFTDASYSDDTYAAGTVKVGTETINDAYLIVKATNQSSNTELKLNYIKYKLVANDNFWVPAGKGVREFLEEPEAMLTEKWDIFYAGLTDTGVSQIKFNSVSDYGYKLKFTNLNGVDYNVPFLTNKSTSDLGFKYGDEDDDFIFVEWVANASKTAYDDQNTFISDDDYFAVSDGPAATKEDKAVTNVLRYKSLSTSDSTVTFEDIGSGDTYTVSYTGTLGSSATGQLIVAGATHNFWIGNTSTTANEKYALTMDLDASGALTLGDEVKLVAKGGAIMDMGNNSYSLTTGNPTVLGAATVDVTIDPVASRFDETNAFESVKVTLSTTSTANTMSATANGTLYEVKSDDKYNRRMTKYGALVERYVPDASSSIPEVTIDYPLVQRYGQVFVTMGTVDYKPGTAAAGGKISSTTLNPIAVGLAVLDTDAPAVGSENMIVVGGPCANTVAAALMGNPADCAEGFTPGKAVIKLFADKNALLVAGYEAQETLGACYVLSDYKDYKLTGTEVEVVVADLNTITVNPVE